MGGFAGQVVSGIHLKEILKEAFLKLKDEGLIYKAGSDWNLPVEILKEALSNLKEERWIRKAKQDWNISRKKIKGENE